SSPRPTRSAFLFASSAHRQHLHSFPTRRSSDLCPACKGADLQKKLSVFAAQSSTPAKSFSDRPMQACGSCGDPRGPGSCSMNQRSEEHTSELQSRGHLVCRLLLEKKKLNYASLP